MIRNNEKTELLKVCNTAKTLHKSVIINVYGKEGTGKTYTVKKSLEKYNCLYIDVVMYNTGYSILTEAYNQYFKKQKKFRGSNESRICLDIITAINIQDKRVSIIMDGMESLTYHTRKKGSLLISLKRFMHTNKVNIILIWNTDTRPIKIKGYNIHFPEYTHDEVKEILSNIYENPDISYTKSVKENIFINALNNKQYKRN